MGEDADVRQREQPSEVRRWGGGARAAPGDRPQDSCAREWEKQLRRNAVGDAASERDRRDGRGEDQNVEIRQICGDGAGGRGERGTPLEAGLRDRDPDERVAQVVHRSGTS